MGDNFFVPKSLEISVGDEVVWRNDGLAPHTTTATTNPDNTWDSNLLLPAATYPQAFSVPGSYPYFCTIHPEMVGTITVTP